MSVHETDRHELWLSLCDTLGESRANTLMTMLPLQPVPELATRADMAANREKIRDVERNLYALRSEFGELRSDQTSLRSEFNELRADFGDLRSEFGDLRADFSELRSEFSELRAEVRTDLGAVRSDMSSMRSELKGEMAQLGGDLRAEIARSAIVLGLSLGTLIIAVLGTILTLGFTGAFAP